MAGRGSYSAQAAYGLPAVGDASTSDVTPLSSIGGRSPTDANAASRFHPDSPLFWFGAFLALTFGFAYASTTVRVGPAEASVSAGKEHS